MEQIIITKPNGSKMPMQNKRTATSIKSASQSVSLLGNDVVNITVESPFSQKYGIGDTISIFGRLYKMNRLPKVKKTGMHHFSYDLEFEGIQYDLARATYDLTIDTTNNKLQDVQANSLIGDLRRFANVLITNANRVMQGKWMLGDCPETISDKLLTFGETDNCLSVLQIICREFEIEFEIEQLATGVNIIHFKKSGQIFPYTFEYGKGRGVYLLDRQNVSSSNIVTRLKVFGSTKNITHKYRAQRLCLPGKSKGQSFIEKADAVAKYGIWEATKYFEDIYPSRTGKVTALGNNVLKFVDKDMFDLNTKESDGKTTKYLLPGVSAKIHFNTGNLAGYEFDVHSYDHKTHTFTVVKISDERGDVFPSKNFGAFQISVGDEYKLIDVALPPEYEVEAENNLSKLGETYYKQNCQPKVQYGLELSGSFLKKFVGNGTTVNIFNVGDYIQVKDDDVDVDKSIRINGFKRDLIDEYRYSLTISDTVTANITNRVISDLIDIENVLSINNLKDPIRARANWRSSREVLNMVFDPEGDYYTDKIKPNSIDTLALSVGAKSMQFGLTNTVFEPNYKGNKNLIKVTGGVLTHYTIDEKSARSWNLANNETTLGKDSQAYYIYAACERGDGKAGSIIFSEVQIRVDQHPNFYHFWIGVVNSVDFELKARSISLSYGFTMINGRFIKTGRIESADGETYFDLDNAEIGGNIKIKAGSKGYNDFLKDLNLGIYATRESVTNAINNVSGSLSDFKKLVNGAFKDGIIDEAEAKAIEKYKNIIKDAKASAEAEYNKVYVNPNLKGTAKSGLLNAKVSLWGAISSLLKAVDDAIADKKTTVQEKQEVDKKYNIYITSMANFRKALDEAVLSIIKEGAYDGSLNYLKEAIEENTTDFYGGLTLASIIAARDSNKKVRSYLSGLGDIAFAAGVENFGSTDPEIPEDPKNPGNPETRGVTIYHDGRIVAKKAKIEGDIEALTGSFGLLKIEDDKIRGRDIDGNITLEVTPEKLWLQKLTEYPETLKIEATRKNYNYKLAKIIKKEFVPGEYGEDYEWDVTDYTPSHYSVELEVEKDTGFYYLYQLRLTHKAERSGTYTIRPNLINSTGDGISIYPPQTTCGIKFLKIGYGQKDEYDPKIATSTSFYAKKGDTIEITLEGYCNLPQYSSKPAKIQHSLDISFFVSYVEKKTQIGSDGILVGLDEDKYFQFSESKGFEVKWGANSLKVNDVGFKVSRGGVDFSLDGRGLTLNGQKLKT